MTPRTRSPRAGPERSGRRLVGDLLRLEDPDGVAEGVADAHVGAVEALTLLDRARRGDVALVACYSVSRLSRSVADLYDTLQLFQDRGTGFVSASEPIETTTPMGRAFLGILAVLAQLDREQTSHRVTDALAFKRMPREAARHLASRIRAGRGWHRHRRSGGSHYQNDLRGICDRGSLVPHTGPIAECPRHQPIAVRGGNGTRPAPLWSGDVLKEILARPTYAGMIETEDGLRPGEQPAIVSLEVFRRCEDIRRRHRPDLGGIVRARRHRESPFALIPVSGSATSSARARCEK